MGIPESQLETWSHQGSITQSAETYGAIKSALEVNTAPYYQKNYKVFLQGSYGNDTNIYAESDVDVIIQLDDVYYSDISNLSSDDKEAYNSAFIPATYSFDEYKKDVRKVLEDRFGKDVTVGAKALTVAANGNRRKSDVIAGMQYRRYYSFKSSQNASFDEGICFFDESNKLIANYPKQHSANLTSKHQNTNEWLKPMVRILKNLRSKLVVEGLIEPGGAPSYFLEGLLYNVPSVKFGSSYGDSFVNAINWIQQEADKTKLVCANEQYYLLWNHSPTSWEKADAEKFLTAAIKLWNDW